MMEVKLFTKRELESESQQPIQHTTLERRWKDVETTSERPKNAVYHLGRVSSIYPSRQISRKSSVEECIFEYMTLHIECRFNKNSLLQCYFLVILLAGIFVLFILVAKFK